MKRLLAALSLVVVLVAIGVPASAHNRLRALSGCGADASTSLATYLNGLANNATVTLPKNGCFTIDSTLQLLNINGLTINGNGATLYQGTAPAEDAMGPIVELWNDSNIRINHLTIDGAYNGSNGGAGAELDYGIHMEADTNVTVSNSTIENIQGDWVFLSQPYDVPDTDPQLSTGITFSQDKFLNAGYHGFTVESVGCPTSAACNGLTIANSTMTNIDVDAMDFEVDTYSSGIASNGTANFSVEDYVTIKNNVWTDWGDDWFASLQGQTPGVQEQHLTFTGNTLDANSAFFEVVGTETFETTAPYLDSFWTIEHNHYGPGYYSAPYEGGSSPNSSIYSVAGLIMENNTLPDCPGGTAPCLGDPSEYAMDLFNSSYSTIENNNFTGTLGTTEPQSYNEQDHIVAVCNNRILAGSNDASC